jgi:protein phosphatase
MHDLTSQFETGAATHVGKLREQNEDSYLAIPGIGVWAVADGMGGHMAGDVASQTVVQELAQIPAPSSAAELLASCEARIVRANSRLQAIAEERGGATVGTTVAVLLIFTDAFACIWAGDSRLYRLHDSGIEQISVDHSEAQSLVDEGKLTPEEAKAWPRRNIITRAIGIYDSPELEMKNGTLGADDVFLLCSDGLTNHVDDEEIFDLASRHAPQQACDRLVELTLERGATDNVTVVIVRPHSISSSKTRVLPSGLGG